MKSISRSFVLILITIYIPFQVHSKKRDSTQIDITQVSQILSSDLYSDTQSLDISQTIYGYSILNENYENKNFDSSSLMKNLQNLESLSPTNDIFPLRNKDLKNLYLKSVKEKEISSIRELNKNIAENYPESLILMYKNGRILSEEEISQIRNKLENIRRKPLPSIKEEELEIENKYQSEMNEESFVQSKDVMNKFSDIFGILSSIPRELRAEILTYTHKIIEETGKDLSNLPDIFFNNGIHILLQPLSDIMLDPSDIIKIYSSLFEENSDNFLIFLEIVEIVLISTLSFSNIIPPSISRKLKEASDHKNKSLPGFKQQSSNFWYNTICQTIQNIELLGIVYPFLTPPSHKKVMVPVEVIPSPKTPSLGAGFRELLEKGVEGSKTEMIETSFTLTQELIFDGWKKSLNEMRHTITSKFGDTKSLCIKYKLIQSKKESLESINESYQVRKFKGLFKDFKNDEELSKHDKINNLKQLGLDNSSIKLSTDERQSIITLSTNFLLSIADNLSEIDLLSKCFHYISNSKSIENKNKVLSMDNVLFNILKQPYTIEKVQLSEWKQITTLIPKEFKKTCVIALHTQYIDCYKKYKQLHYTLQQPAVVNSIISKLQESSDIIGETAAKSASTGFSWRSLYQADATFTYYFSILDLNRLIAFNQIISNVVLKYEPIKDIYSIPPKESRKSKALRFWNSVKGTWIFRIITFGLFSFIGYIDKGYTVEKCLFIPRSKQGEPEPTIIW